MSDRAVLFDLDDTLIPEVESLEAAFAVTCELAIEKWNCELTELSQAVLSHARELWRASPVIDFCRALGIGSWEGLSSDFPGNGQEFKYLREWIPSFRTEAWSRGLGELGIFNERMASELAGIFKAERRNHHVPYEDVAAVLKDLGHDYRLGVITNGLGDLQRSKLRVSGLESNFEVILVSGEMGFGKPDARIFHAALKELAVDAADAVMIGDHTERDVDGAVHAGLRAIWLDRKGFDVPPTADHDRISTLSDLLPLLAGRAR